MEEIRGMMHATCVCCRMRAGLVGDLTRNARAVCNVLGGLERLFTYWSLGRAVS